jgi:hypothetical protein
MIEIYGSSYFTDHNENMEIADKAICRANHNLGNKLISRNVLKALAIAISTAGMGELANRPLTSGKARRGRPPCNQRLVLMWDLRRALKEAGHPAGFRATDPRSALVELYLACLEEMAEAANSRSLCIEEIPVLSGVIAKENPRRIFERLNKNVINKI